MRFLSLWILLLLLCDTALARTFYGAGESEYTLIWESRDLALGQVGELDLLVARFPTTDDQQFVLSGGIDLQVRRRGTDELSPLAHRVEHLGGDRYRISGLLLHVAGIWDLELTYQIGTERFQVLHSIQVAPIPGVAASMVAAHSD